MSEKQVFKFKLQIDISDLDKYDPYPSSAPSALFYDAEVILDTDNYHEVTLKIFHNSDEGLEYKVQGYSGLEYEIVASKKREKFLDKIKFLDSIKPFTLINVDFEGYRWKSITPNKVEDIQSLDIKTTGVNLTFSVEEPCDSVFYLNKESFDLIEPNFYYQPHFGYQNKKYTWSPETRVKDYLSFNEILYKPDFNIYSSNSSKETVTITKEPIIRLTYNELSKKIIEKHIHSICSLYSFYSGKNVNYHYSEIYVGRIKYVQIRNIPKSFSDFEHWMFRFEIRNPIHLIASVDPKFVVEHVDFISSSINRFNQALQLEGESKFMLLYNILEQIRNYYIINVNPNVKSNVAEFYTFKNTRKEINGLIKNLLTKISEFVSDDLKEAFEDEIISKAREVKRLTMKNQFKSLFEAINIKPEKNNLDFKELLKLRNEVFHGNPISDIQLLERVNNFQCLPKFTGMVILKFMGINNLGDIKRIAN